MLARTDAYQAVGGTVAVDPAAFSVWLGQTDRSLGEQHVLSVCVNDAQVALGHKARDEVPAQAVIGDAAVAQRVRMRTTPSYGVDRLLKAYPHTCSGVGERMDLHPVQPRADGLRTFLS
ncbi:hypothetical protein BKH36_11755 [Actinomyces naeslundii]|nr:hypothetical protein BKH36_11755 [Actinomyces naeslundii]